MFSSSASSAPRALHSFPTRRSSDLTPAPPTIPEPPVTRYFEPMPEPAPRLSHARVGSLGSYLAKIQVVGDRKSTRLNSSHTVISYAVFCLKKKKQKK